MNVPWWVYLVLANLAIAVLEFFYRRGDFFSFWEALPYLVIPMLVGQWGLFNGFRVGGAGTLLIAVAVFNVINALLRMGNSYLLGEIPNWANWLGILLMIGGMLLLRVR